LYKENNTSGISFAQNNVMSSNGSSQKVCGHNILKKIGLLIILGDLNIISQTKGRISRFPRSAKVF